MKKLFAILLVVSLVCIPSSVVFAFSSSNDIPEYKVMVPFCSIFEKLGFGVSWEAETQTVRGTKEGLTITLRVGSQTALVNDEVKSLTVAPKIVEGTLFVPLRFIGESAQREVVWDGDRYQLIIADTESQIQHVLFIVTHSAGLQKLNIAI
jgi:hypothetical protein